MTTSTGPSSFFLQKATDLVQEQLGNEQFGVSELAAAMHMSRSNLLRKIKKETGLSASQFIRRIRLQEAHQLLKEGEYTVSEVAFQVGFNSASYFIKCFREEYNHSPGEMGTIALEQEDENKAEKLEFKKIIGPILAACLLIGVLAVGVFKNKTSSTPVVDLKTNEPEKSIAVLPFRNESSDSTNIYFVNGLMESTLTNLQRMDELLVISRTSSEKYRHTQKGVPEIAKELNVNYLVEGSGQRVGNEVLLNIKLIDANTDTPVWSAQYQEEISDLFALQRDVAQKIARAIEVVISPKSLEQLDKIPTSNMEAYDLYLQAMELQNTRSPEGYAKAVPLFEQALSLDDEFALAYANLAITYHLMDQFKEIKQHQELLGQNADRALFHDPKNDICLIAKALYYLDSGEYRLVVPHLEKALKYNPNSIGAIQILSIVYSNYIPNTTKYLKNALKGVRLEKETQDSIAQSYLYLNLSNALAQNAFDEQALKYINRTLELDPQNYFAPMLKAFIEYSLDRDLEKTRTSLLRELEKDSNRVDLLQEVAKMHFFQEDYRGAYRYYKRFVTVRQENKYGVFPQEYLKISDVFARMGETEKAAEFFALYADYCERDQSIYKGASTALKLAYEGKIEEGMEQLKLFATQDDYQYWILLFMEEDPLMKPLRTHPDYPETIQKIHERFWKNQAKLKVYLEENRLL